MRIEICYNLTSLEKTAQFVWDNNPYVKKWYDAPKDVFGLIQRIRNDALSGVHKNVNVLKREKAGEIITDNGWLNSTGTGGYTIHYSLEDETDDYVLMNIEFLVNPAVGEEEPIYVSEDIDISNDDI